MFSSLRIEREHVRICNRAKAALQRLQGNFSQKEQISMRKVREAGKAAIGGGRSANSSSGMFYHLLQEEYDQMLADPDCDKELFEAEAVEILEKKRVEADLVYKIREDVIRKAGLRHWIDM